MPYAQYAEAIRRLQEISTVINTDALSGKSKMNTLANLLNNYFMIDRDLEIGETGTYTDMYFGESREIVSLGMYSRHCSLNIQVDVLDSHIKYTSPK